MLGGGKVTDCRKKATYILGDVTRTHINKVYVTPYWILDSLTQMQLLSTNKYNSPTSFGQKALPPQVLEDPYPNWPAMQLALHK